MQHDLTRNTLAAILVVGLIALCFWVLRPFLAATVWATMIVVATWPWLKALERLFGNRRTPAVLIMTIGMLLLLVMPFLLVEGVGFAMSPRWVVFPTLGTDLVDEPLPVRRIFMLSWGRM